MRLLRGENNDGQAARTEWERLLRASQEEAEEYKRQFRDKENEKNFFENELKKAKSFQISSESDKNKFIGSFSQLQEENAILSNEILNLRNLNAQLQAKYDQSILDNIHNEETIKVKLAEFDHAYNNIVYQFESEHSTCESLKTLLQSRNDEYANKELGLINLLIYFTNSLIAYQDQIRLRIIEIEELNVRFKKGSDGQIIMLSTEIDRLNALVNEKIHELEFLQTQLSTSQQFHREEKEQLTSHIEYQVKNEIVKSKAIHEHEKMTMSAAIDDKAQRIKDLTEENNKLLSQLYEKQKENESHLIQINYLDSTIQGLRHEVEINTRSILVRDGYDILIRFIRTEKFKN